MEKIHPHEGNVIFHDYTDDCCSCCTIPFNSIILHELEKNKHLIPHDLYIYEKNMIESKQNISPFYDKESGVISGSCYVPKILQLINKIKFQNGSIGTPTY